MLEVPYGIVYMTSRVFRGEVVKRYIGRHKWREGQSHDTYLGSGVILARALKKYGRESFTRETLEVCYSHEELNKAEAKWVDLYSAVESPLFYNIANGGMNTANINGKEIHQYTLGGDYVATFNSSADAARATNLNRQNILKAGNSETFTVGGFQWRFALRDKFTATAGTCEKPVFCYGLDGVFVRDFHKIKAAADWVGAFNGSNITACCRGIRPLAHNYQWSYEKTDSRPAHKGECRNRKRGVLQLDAFTFKKIAEFPSHREAGAAVSDLPRSSERVSVAIKTGGKFKGYRWSYV